MKKKLTIVIISILLMTVFTVSAYADTPVKKLGRGICNIVTCPLELFKAMQDIHNEDGFFAALTWGLLKGTFNTGVRAVVGAYEVVTFPFPVPSDYEPILTDPEFFGEETLF